MEAAKFLRRGGLVAFPTETVYGLRGNALDGEAAGRIYPAKRRPSDNYIPQKRSGALRNHGRPGHGGDTDAGSSGGPVGIGVEPTIVDVSSDVPALLRPGAVTMEMLRGVLGEVSVDPAIMGPLPPDIRPKAPGMKYRHYARPRRI